MGDFSFDLLMPGESAGYDFNLPVPAPSTPASVPGSGLSWETWIQNAGQQLGNTAITALQLKQQAQNGVQYREGQPGATSGPIRTTNGNGGTSQQISPTVLLIVGALILLAMKEA